MIKQHFGHVPGLVWFRIFGWGLWAASYKLHKPYYSERHGYHKTLKFKTFRVKLLTPRGIL